ncbi:MAG TPA: gluconokinase [Thermomicrobiales bacterium]|nr:gluconokinase [Thermomicrobiales bacterium]
MPVVDVQNAEQPLVLALDIGTSSTRAIIFDRRGHALRDSECQLKYELTTTPDGGAEVDARMLADLVGKSIDAVLERHKVPIAAVGVAAFWHSLMGVDADGEPTTPVYLWADTRSREDVDAIKQEFDAHELWQRTGCFVHSSYWPGKLRWLARTQPDLVRTTRTWCSFTGYLLRKLFGADGISVSMASSTAMMNATTHQWDDLAIAASGVDPDRLAPIRHEREPLTGMAPEFSRRWPALAEAPWFRGIGDGACANVGSGGLGPNRIALTVGTSGAMRMVRRLPAGSSPNTPETLWTYRLDDRAAVIGAAISNGGKVVDWIGDLTGSAFGSEAFRCAEQLEPDSHGLTILPFLAGERAPIWSDWATGAVSGLNLATTAADLIRAGMESVSYRLGMIYADLATQAEPDHQILANGGAILRSPVWMQMIADVTQHSVVALPPEEESTARGAALMALEYAGLIKSLFDADDPAGYGQTIEPDPGRAEVYRAAMERQNRMLDLLYQDGKPLLGNP